MLSHKGRAIYFPKTGIVGQAAEAKSKKINATAGIAVEDDGTPMRLNSIAEKIKLSPGDIFNYAPTYGKPELRRLWLKKIKEKNPSLNVPISLPIVTGALTHGLSITAYLFINSGEKIILTDKFWGNYRLTFENEAGGELDAFNTFKEGCFDLKSFADKLSQVGKKKIVLLNFPNNPSGYTATEDEAKAIVAIIKKRAEAGDSLVVILDDAYFGLVYEEGIMKESLFSLLAGLHPNILAIKIDGATKEDYVWGLRVGFLTYGIKDGSEPLYRALEDKTAGTIRGSISNVSNLSQSLVYQGLSSPAYREEKKQKYQILKNRYEKVKGALGNKKYREVFSPLPYNSGYFMCLELAPELEAEAVRKLLLEKYDTGTIAIKNNLRIAFSAVAEKNLPQLFENIYSACLELKK